MSVTENHPLRPVAQPGILSTAAFTTNSAYSVLRLADLPNLTTALSALAASSNSADVWRVNMANFSAFSWVCSFVSFAASSAPISSQKSQALVVRRLGAVCSLLYANAQKLRNIEGGLYSVVCTLARPIAALSQARCPGVVCLRPPVTCDKKRRAP